MVLGHRHKLCSIEQFSESRSMIFSPIVPAAARSASGRVPRFPKKTKSRSRAFNVKLFLDSTGLGRKVAKFLRKETVFGQGDTATNVMYIQEGGVKLTVLNEVGREAVVAILGPGDFFGEGCLAGQSICMATATAIAPTTVLVIEKNEMIRVLHGEHEFSDRFIAHMLARNIRVEADLVDQLFNSTEKRLARTLLLLARYGAPGQPKKGAPQGIARDAGGDHRHDAIPGQFIHEQIQETGFHHIQRRNPHQPFPAERCPARLNYSLRLGSKQNTKCLEGDRLKTSTA